MHACVEYTVGKCLERYIKVLGMCNKKRTVSSAPPGYYAKRFVESMNEYIQPTLSQLQVGQSPDGRDLMAEIENHDWEQYDRDGDLIRSLSLESLT